MIAVGSASGAAAAEAATDIAHEEQVSIASQPMPEKDNSPTAGRSLSQPNPGSTNDTTTTTTNTSSNSTTSSTSSNPSLSSPLCSSTPDAVFKKPETSWKRKITCSRKSTVGKVTENARQQTKTEILISETEQDIKEIEDELETAVNYITLILLLFILILTYILSYILIGHLFGRRKYGTIVLAEKQTEFVEASPTDRG